MWGYINKPSPSFTIHHKSNCPQIRKNGKEKQRCMRANDQDFKEKLSELENDPHPFSESVPPNDMWIEVNLSLPQQNEDFFNDVRKILVKKYPRLAKALIIKHNCPDK